MRVFLGYDKREAIGFHVCVQSIIEHTRGDWPEITPLYGERRDGTNDFIYARFFIPWLCGFKGQAIFIDGSDMLLREDIWNIRSRVSRTAAVSVVKHDYKTRHPRKYLGTPMEADNRDYPRKNWSSVMVFNCGHPANRILDANFVENHTGEYLHGLGWLEDRDIGELHPRWNVLIGEDGEDRECALAHFTLGIPAFSRYSACKYADEWFATHDRMLGRV